MQSLREMVDHSPSQAVMERGRDAKFGERRAVHALGNTLPMLARVFVKF
jgi:hypothetical protein